MAFNRRGRRFRWMIFFPLAFVAITLLLGAAVMFLWNAVLPAALNAKTLTYWQAVGLLILSRILFGNFGRRGRGGKPPIGSGGGPWRDKLMNMTPEERQRFREEWKSRCKPDR